MKDVPGDILIAIFASMVAGENVPEHGKHLRLICQVCRRWRALTIAFPGFWTRIAAGKCAEHVQLALERSSSIPVEVAALASPIPRPVLTLLSQHASRVRSLCLEDMDPISHPGPPIRARLQVAAHVPYLEHLSIRSLYLANTWDRGLLDEHHALRSLTLVQCDLYIGNSPWPRFFHRLEHLAITYQYVSGSGSAGTAWVVLSGVLQNMRALKTLKLGDMGTVTDPLFPSTDSVQSPSLPCFELLTLQNAHPIFTLHLLHYLALRVPSTAKIVIASMRTPMLDIIPDIAPLADCAFPIFHRIRSLAYTFSSLAQGQTELVVRAYPEDRPPLSHPPTDVEIVLRDTRPEACVTAVRGAFDTLPIDTLDVVGLAPGAEMPLIFELPPCRVLRLVRCHPTAVVALVTPLSFEEMEARWPALARVEVRGVACESGDQFVAMRDALQLLVDERRWKGKPLEAVKVVGVRVLGAEVEFALK